MLRVLNDTEFVLDVVINGVPYHVGANSSVDNIPEEAAMYWKRNLHNFLRVVDESNTEIKPLSIAARESEVEDLDDVSASVAEMEVGAGEVETPKKKTTKK